MKIFQVGLVAGMTLLTLKSVFGAEYRFVNVVDTTSLAPVGLFDEFETAPAFDQGYATFSARFDSQSRSGIFRGNGSSLTKIVGSDDLVPGSDQQFHSAFGYTHPDSEAGVVPFWGSYPGGYGVFFADGTASKKVVKTGDLSPAGTPFTAFGNNTSIQNGSIGLIGLYGSTSAVLTATSAGVSTIIKSGEAAPEGTFGDFNFPVVDGETTAFLGYYGASSQGIFKKTGAALTTIVKTGDPTPSGKTFSNFNKFSLSGGTAAFIGYLHAINHAAAGVYIGSGGPITAVVSSGDAAPAGSFADFYRVSIAGDLVAYAASFDGFTRDGLFTSENGPLNPVIQTGEALFGSQIAGIDLSRFGLDPAGSGNIAFRYYLTDGRTGIALALRVPEPSSAFMASALSLIVIVADVRQSAGRRVSLVVWISNAARNSC